VRTLVCFAALLLGACEAAPTPTPATTADATADPGSLSDTPAGTTADAQADAAADAAADTAQADAPPKEIADTAAPDLTPTDTAPTDSALIDTGDIPPKPADASDAPTNDIADTAVPDLPPTDVPPADIPPADVPAPDAAPTDAGPACVGDGKPVQCSGAAQASFPSFPNTCKGDTDCFAAFHQINCCGTQIGYGLATCAKDVFTAAETTCEGQYPGCDCALFPTLCEDGFTAMNGNGDVGVHCKAGQCRTFVKTAKLNCENEAQGFPKPWKLCQQDSDCAYVLHYKDCCGSLSSFGIAAWAKSEYDSAEQKCFAGKAFCNCLSKPTTTEDGQSEGKGGIGVKCQQGACLTYAKP
jgi:hypothetical protein